MTTKVVAYVEHGEGVSTAFFFDQFSELVYENVRIREGWTVHVEDRVVCGRGKKGWLPEVVA